MKRAVEQLRAGDTWSLFLFAKQLRRMDFGEAGKFIGECEEGRGDADFRAATDLSGALAGVRFDLLDPFTGEPYDIRKPEAMEWVAARREAGS